MSNPLSVRKRFASFAIVLLFILFCSTGITRLSVAGVRADSTSAKDGFKVTTVFLVRHAEKAPTPPEDPPLSDKGKVRAERLSEVLQKANIKAIYTSQFLRTKQTVEPLARRLGLTAVAIPIKMDRVKTFMVAEESTRAFTDKIYGSEGDAVLIVGHSNTLPEIIKMLGGDTVPELGEKEYDDIFVVTVYGKGKSKVTRVKYGDPSQP